MHTQINELNKEMENWKAINILTHQASFSLTHLEEA